MEYKKYDIVLNDEGKIACRELGIVGDTVEEVKKAIRAAEVVRETKPKINVLYRHGYMRNVKYYEGTTTGRVTMNKYERVWLSYTLESGKKRREKVSYDDLILDTPENRAIIAQIVSINEKNNELEDQMRDLEYQLTKLK